MLSQRLLMVNKRLTYAQTVLQDKPVAFWQLNETSGTVAYDSSGNGYNAAYVGGFTLGQAGIPAGGKSVLFDGTSGYVSYPGVPLTADASVTLEGWINLESWNGSSTAGHGAFIKCGDDNSGYGLGLGNNSDWDNAGNYIEGLYEMESWNPLSTATQVPLTGWHLLHMVIESNSTSSYYLDGQLVGTNSNSTIITPANYTDIAQDNGSTTRFLLCNACNIALYNGILSQSRMQAHYNAGIA